MSGKFTIFASVTLISGAAFLAIAVVLPNLTAVESAKNVSTVAWLPSTASNVSYARNYSRQYFEFSISEPEFLALASEYSLSEIADPIHMPRYTQMLGHPTELTVDIENNPKYTAVITDGLTDSRTLSNHGGYMIAFDRKQNRGYFKSASR